MLSLQDFISLSWQLLCILLPLSDDIWHVTVHSLFSCVLQWNLIHTIRYDTIVCLTCSKKLTDSQLSLPHGTNKKLKCETKNKMMSMIGPLDTKIWVLTNLSVSYILMTVSNTIMNKAVCCSMKLRCVLCAPNKIYRLNYGSYSWVESCKMLKLT